MLFRTIAGAAGLFIASAACAQGAPASAPSSTPATTSPAASAAPLTLSRVLQGARDNLDVSLAQRAVASARADVTAADHSPAPVVTAKTSSIDLQNGIGGGNVLRDKRIDKSLGIDWTWERGGKRELRTRSAERAAGAAQADLQETLVQQQIAASSAFYDLLAAQEKITQVDAIGKSAAELATQAGRRNRAGDLSQQETLRIEIEAQRADADLRAARDDRRRAELALGLITGLRGPMQAQVEWPTLAVPAEAPDADAMLAQMADARPDVRAAAQRLEAAQAAFDGALALRKADLTVGTSLDHFPGTSTRLLELRVSMPLAGVLGSYNYDGEIARARAQLDQAQDQLYKTRRAAVADTLRLAQDLRAAALRAASYDQAIVPRARRVADMSELAYGKGAMALVDLIDARRTLRTVLLEDLAARADHARLLAAWQLRTAPPAP